MHLPGKLNAPISKGQTVGEVVVKLGKQVVAKEPLIALHSDPRGNLWQRLRDTVLQWFHK